MRLIVFAVTAVLVSAAPFSLASAQVFFDNETDFFNAAEELTLESFEGLGDTTFSNSPIVAGGLSITPNAAPARIRSTSTGGHFATDGIRYIESGSGTESIELVFDLAEPSFAFGLSITDFGDNGTGGLVFKIAMRPPEPFVVSGAPAANGNLIFFGVVDSTPFSRVTLTTESFIDDDGIGIDGVFTSASVPQPIILGDVNIDGVVNFSDITPFIAVLQSGEFQAEADVDLNLEVNFADIAPFIDILSGQ